MGGAIAQFADIQVVRKLEANGCVTKTPSSTDGRATTVRLTPAGRELVSPIKQRLVQLAQETVQGLEATSPSTLVDVLGDLARGLSTGAGRKRQERRAGATSAPGR